MRYHNIPERKERNLRSIYYYSTVLHIQKYVKIYSFKSIPFNWIIIAVISNGLRFGVSLTIPRD